MAMSVTDRIFSDYEQTRARHERERRHRISAVAAKFPRIAEIDAEINRLGMDTLKKIMAEPKRSAELNASMKESIEKLKKEKEALLSANGIPADYSRLEYDCEKCRDTGYIGTAKCDCYMKKLADASYADSNLEKLVAEQNFENFSFDMFKGEARARMEILHRRAMEFCEDFEKPGKSIFMTGKVGRGKTYLSSCIAKAVMDKGFSVLYIRASKFFELCRKKHYGRLTEEESVTMDRTVTDDLLIIDDLGSEVGAEVINQGSLLDVVSERLLKKKKLIINTNYVMSQIDEKYSNRMTSRIYENFILLQFVGKDLRTEEYLEKLHKNKD